MTPYMIQALGFLVSLPPSHACAGGARLKRTYKSPTQSLPALPRLPSLLPRKVEARPNQKSPPVQIVSEVGPIIVSWAGISGPVTTLSHTRTQRHKSR